MKRIAINGKFLLMINEHAERLADIIEKRTGHRPQVTEARTEANTKPDIYFCRLNPKYGE